MKVSKTPNFFFENKLWKKGIEFVAGVDEVGRGCFAGPVVAACVVFDNTFKDQILRGSRTIIINDSKKLTKLQREQAEKWIKENAVTWGVGEASAKVINRVGMAKATKMAFRRAVINANRKLNKSIQFLLVDAFYVPYLRGFPKGRKKLKGHKNPALRNVVSQLAIINGDEKSISIAAASIVAKVYRDNLMRKIGSRAKYKKYDWVSNKGYATRHHRDTILKYGITSYHRKQFVDTFLSNQ